MGKYKLNLDVFYNEGSTSWYLLGAILTDGCIWTNKKRQTTKAVRLVSKDIDWLINIKNLICSDLPIHSKSSKEKIDCGELWICSSKLAEWLILKGCTPTKSLDVKFPTVPEIYLQDFIRGCIDGDGCLACYKEPKGNYSYKVNLCSGSELFINSINDVLKTQGFKPHILKRDIAKPHIMSSGRLFTQKHPYFEINFRGSYAIDIIKWLYYPSHELSMPRKYSIAIDMQEKFYKYQSKRVQLCE